MIDKEQLLKIMPLAGGKADAFLEPLNNAMEEFGIDTPQRQAAFLAQVAHESAQLRAVAENLNYSADALLATFPRYFDRDTAATYQRQPHWIASRVYANRMGNGDQASGDGWNYRGRGLIQITGKDSYSACSEALFADENFLIQHPETLEQPVAATRSAAWYWMENSLNDYADSGDFRGLTKRINGGLNGIQDREAYLERATAALA